MNYKLPSSILPWHAELWQQLWHLNQENRLPHALLFTGPLGIGKYVLAQAFSQAILCQNPGEYGVICEKCHACHLVQANSHPDLRIIEPEEKGHAIKIDQIRELSEFIQNTSHQGGYRIVIIQPATAMNHYASNALLKTLEEPTPNTLLILISDQRLPLPATIVSRCQSLHMSMPDRDQALRWLKCKGEAQWAAILDATQGAPLLAQDWHAEGVWPLYQNFMRDLIALGKQEVDPLQLAVQWKEVNMLWIFDLFFQWILKLMRNEQNHLSSTQLWEFVDHLQHLRANVLGPYNLNQQLLLESLFIRWAQYAAR